MIKAWDNIYIINSVLKCSGKGTVWHFGTYSLASWQELDEIYSTHGPIRNSYGQLQVGLALRTSCSMITVLLLTAVWRGSSGWRETANIALSKGNKCFLAALLNAQKETCYCLIKSSAEGLYSMQTIIINILICKDYINDIYCVKYWNVEFLLIYISLQKYPD